MAFTPLTFVLSSILICGIVAWILHTKSTSSKNLPPGPKAYPLVGCIPELLFLAYVKGLDKAAIMKYLTDKYGAIYCLNIFGYETIVLTDHLTIKEAYQNPFLSNRANSKLAHQLPGKTWIDYNDAKTHRKIILGALSGKYGFKRGVIEDRILRECEILKDAVKTHNGNVFDIQLYIRNATASVMFSVFIGVHLDWNNEGLKQVMKANSDRMNLAFKSFASRIFIPSNPLFESELHRKMMSCNEFVLSYVDNLIVTHERSKNEITNITDVYLQELHSSDPQLDKDFLREGLNMLVAAGFDSTVFVLSRLITLIAAHTKIQERVQQEMDQVVGRNQVPCLSDKDKLHYTQATICELLRRGQASASNPHTASQETTLKGYTIPKGATLIALNSMIRHDATMWPDPDTTRPERFLDEHGNFQEPTELFVFGTGRRKCAGETLAKMELFLFLTNLLHRFTFELPDGIVPFFSRWNGFDNDFDATCQVQAFPR